ncbi:hypothetical protein QJS10_CPB18g01688 [Acorus calamus]|uniref:Uncharacterized protein n=1 Tax=Acorus calamus TaxID=4465 RepID=A0AAV9CRJ9_ACOCL|nr:hypothetical protein QJS10_CPB18g01688 [Acorus calamus]
MATEPSQTFQFHGYFPHRGPFFPSNVETSFSEVTNFKDQIHPPFIHHLMI